MHGRISTLWNLMAGQQKRYLGGIAALASGTALMFLSPLVVRGAIDGLIDRAATPQPVGIARVFREFGDMHGLGFALALAGGALVTITSLGGVLLYLKGKLAAQASENIAKSIRERLYAHLQHVSMTYHDKAQTGDVVQRCTSDVDTVRSFFSSQAIDIVHNLLRVLIVLPILISLDWSMAIVSTAVMPVIVAFAVIFFSKVQGTFKKEDEAEGAMTATLQENLTGIRVVRAFARQEFEIARFREKNETHRRANWRLYTVLACYWASSDFLCMTQSALLLLTGAWRVLHGTLSVGTLVAFVSYGQMFIWPIREVGRVLSELGKALVSIGRIEEILEIKEETDPENPIENLPLAIRGEIELRDVQFSFGEQPVLSGLSLRIPAGSTMAIVGPSGSGKTTLVNLLLRMYDYSTGSITLDGMELNRLPRKFIRGQFGVVLQEPFLYSKTLGQNMKLGRHEAADDEMFAAARVSAIHETVQGFEKQYETIVGERGVTLSGGQRQRTAIARALLRDAPILILDDAFSAVDTHTETAILDSLRQSRGKHTVILIAHRLSTLMHADQIAVMEKGRITQLGTHEQLVASDGLYRRLWQIQSALEDDLRAEFDGKLATDGAVLQTAKSP